MTLHLVCPCQVITADGYQEPRLVIAVNGSFPAPTLEVYEHQTVRVHVRNNMASETTSLHFHGMFQRGTPWMDGVGMVTQCPILPGQSFTYQVCTTSYIIRKATTVTVKVYAALLCHTGVTW